jgi:ParB family chromosome partitioning protein
MSGPLDEYVRLHRHGAIRASLLDSPSTGLRVSVAHMLVGSHLWTCTPARTKSRKESTTKSVAASPNAARVETERQEVLSLIGLPEATATYGDPSTIVDGSFAQVFAALLAQPDAVVMRVMTLAMSLTLALDADIVEAVGLELKPDMSALWSPDDAFFDILRDKRVINAMLKEIGGKSFADSLVSETGTKQKAALRNRFSGVGVSEDMARGDWRPRWMQDVPTHYLDRKTCPPAQAAALAKKALKPKV